MFLGTVFATGQNKFISDFCENIKMTDCTIKYLNGQAFECCEDEICSVDTQGNRITCIRQMLNHICGEDAIEMREEKDPVTGQIALFIVVLFTIAVICFMKWRKRRRENRRVERAVRRVVSREIAETSL